MSKILTSLLILLWTGILFCSCRKSEESHPAEVFLVSPEENSLLKLPDTLQVKFKIETEKDIDFAGITLVNKNYTPLFGTKYIDNPPRGELISTSMILSALEPLEDAPFYFLISLKISGETEHNYFSIRLANKPLNYKGFYTFIKTSVHELAIDYYNEAMEKKSFFQLSGDYLDSDISGFYERLYVTTGPLEKLIAFDLTDQQPAWEAEPAMPYPEYTDICSNAGRLYAAMGNGQIVGYANLNGQLQYVAERLNDSIPEKIIVLDDYLVGYYCSRMNARKSLVSFYTATGVKKHQYPIDFKVVSFFSLEEPDNTLILGNREAEGLAVVFTPHENYLGEIHSFNFGTVDAACQTEEGTYAILSGNRLYTYDYITHQEQLIKILEDSAFMIKYEKVTNQLFVLFPDKIDRYAYPEMQEISGMNFEASLKGVAFYYKYE